MEATFHRIHYKDAVEVKKDWETSLLTDLLYSHFEEDKELYETEEDMVTFLTRRFATLCYLDRHDWEKEVSRVCWEIICDTNGKLTEEFLANGLHNSLFDFIQHVFYFEIVREIMLKHIKVDILSENSSTIHDIDKLHPIMLAGYAEKFQDGKDTSLWKECVKHHIKINPHHQDNALWHNGSCNEYKISKDVCTHCEALRSCALAEMVCDKVSRKLQKEHHGVVCEEMWNVDPKFFEGLPALWLDKAYKTINEFKRK